MKSKATTRKKTSEPKPSSSRKGKRSGNIGQGKGRKATLGSSAGVPGTVASSVMQNNLILCAIAMKLPARNLLPLRKTSTLWNYNFLPQLARKHKPINLHTTPTYPGCWLISDYANATHIPIRSYNIHNLGIGPEEGGVKNFFKLRGNIITRLDLELDNLNSATIESFRQIVFEWTPELRELSIWSLDYETPESLELEPPLQNQIEPLKKDIPKLRMLKMLTGPFMCRQYYCLVKDLIQCAVGLEYVALQDWERNSYLEKVQLLSVVPGLSRLKGLKVSGITAEHLRDLIHLSVRKENPLRLMELGMSTVCSSEGELLQGATDAEIVELINRFLSTQSNTLRSLDIAVDVEWPVEVENAGYTPQLPKMDNVQTLTLQYDQEWRSVVLPQEETFASNFPGLKRLTFNYDEVLQAYTNPDRARHISQFAHEGVTSLKLEMKEAVTQSIAAEAVLLADFSHTWPFVSKLELQIRTSMLNNILSSIWTWWPNLVSLRLEQKRNVDYVDQFAGPVKLDEFLSGIPESNFVQLRRRLRAINSTVVTKNIPSLRVLQTEYKTKPGISDLKQLQEFVLDARDHKFRISDIGGYLGFAMMPCQAVQHIALIHRAEARFEEEDGERQQCKSNVISRPCRNFMRSVFGLNAVLDL